jgi:hypothetical protein
MRINVTHRPTNITVVLYSYVNIKIHTYSNVFIVNVLFLFLFEKRLQRRYGNEGENITVVLG